MPRSGHVIGYAPFTNGSTERIQVDNRGENMASLFPGGV